MIKKGSVYYLCGLHNGINLEDGKNPNQKGTEDNSSLLLDIFSAGL
jgi:hypothetical protein